MSYQLGMMPQVTGIISNKRYGGAVLTVNNATDFIYIYLIHSATAATLAANHAYKGIAKSYGVQVKSW